TTRTKSCQRAPWWSLDAGTKERSYHRQVGHHLDREEPEACLSRRRGRGSKARRHLPLVPRKRAHEPTGGLCHPAGFRVVPPEQPELEPPRRPPQIPGLEDRGVAQQAWRRALRQDERRRGP